MPRIKKKSNRKIAEEKKSKRKEKVKRIQDSDLKSQEDLKVLAEQNKKNRLKRNQQKRLNDPLQLELHRERSKKYQKKLYQNSKQRKLQSKRSALCQWRRLQNPEKLNEHRIREKISQRRRLQDPEKLNEHRVREKISQRRRLQDPEKINEHRVRAKISQRRRLQDPEKLNEHRVREKISQRRRLQDPEKLNEHRVREKISQRRRLQDPEKLKEHRIREKISQQRRLQDPGKMNEHRVRAKLNQRKRLLNPDKQKTHQKRVKICQYKRLKDPEKLKVHRNYAKRYQIMNRKSHSLAVQRSKFKKYMQSEDLTRNCAYESFISSKKEGPIYECVCCCRLFFRESVRYYRTSDLKNCKSEFLQKTCIKMIDDVGYLCFTCKKSLSSNNIPKLSICNDQLKFPEVHEAIKKLTDLEERFVAPRIPFMQIRAIYNEQYMQKGRAVNVPCEIVQNLSILPRAQTETKLIPIVFRKKKKFKNNLMVENVRPKVIEEAARALENSALYQFCGIKVDTSKLVEINLTSDMNDKIITHYDNEDCQEEEEDDTEPLNVPDDETLLSNAVVFAPGEGKKPVSLFDKYAEAMSFIKIYGGELIAKPDELSYQDWIKSELTRSDRRCAIVSKLFFSASKLRISKIASSIGFCLRKSKTKTLIKASELLEPKFIQKMETHDSGFKIFETDRGSPAFWEQKKKEVFAAIRQLGSPTLFLTLSPAETKWPELIVILKRLTDDEEITEENAIKMEYSEKVRLIRSDPVTVARYIEHRMTQLFKLLKLKNSIFREHYIIDYYIRCEFQQRGSPHWHSLLWLHNAPKYIEGENNTDVISFIDNFISADLDMNNELVVFQTHKHTFTCRKGKNKGRCRFDIPFFPLENTMILHPLNDFSKEDLSFLRKKRDEIQTLLTKLVKTNCQTMTQEDFLKSCNLDLSKYIECIRSGLKRPTVMVKRKVHQCMINLFNPELLGLHRGNMDIQFIVDVYSCANYVVNYLNKSNRGLSRLLRDALSEVRKGNYTMKEKMQFLGNKFLNASEFTAQEAVFYTLSLPLSKLSRQCIFINTSSPEKRILVVKSIKELKCLPPESNDIYQKNLINHYTQRPNSLENICLAHFAAWYNYSKYNCKISSSKNESYDLNKRKDEKLLMLKDSSGYLIKRSKAKIIRYVHYNKHTQKEDFVREQVMLFIPWRIEEQMMENAKSLYQECHDVLKSNCSEFTNEETDNILDKINNEIDDDKSLNNSRETNTPHSFAELGGFSKTPDIVNDLQSRKLNDSSIDVKAVNEMNFPIPNLINEEKYHDLLLSLNQKQREYLLHVLHAFKCGKLPIYDCVLGGAGVGKSRLIETLHQVILRYFNKKIGVNLETIKVLLCAPTGKAAYGIRGITLHSAFSLPFNQTSNEEFTALSTSTANSLYSKLIDLKLIIIDEISMVGSRMLQYLNFRLQQIFKSDELFAGISVIVLGDFNQLSPVGDSLVFQPSRKNDYNEILGINPLWMLFQSFYLTEIMRQKDDYDFATALMNLSKGTLTNKDFSLFKNRECKPEDVPIAAVRLFPTNKLVDSYNETIINQDANKIDIKALDKITMKVKLKQENKLLEKIAKLPARETQGLPTILRLSKGKKYMITNNLNIEDGLVNGAIGTLEDYTTLGKNQLRLWMKFPEDDVGRIRRTEVKHPTLTAIDMVKREIRFKMKRGVSIVRQQFPLVPAEAITIHKSQGATYKSVAVHLNGLKRNALYVALSRCQTLSGLYLLGKFLKPSPKSPLDKVELELERLHKKGFKSSCPFLATYKHHKTILYSNVQSITKHLSTDIWKNILFNSPTFFIAAETWSIDKDEINIPNYEILSRIDCSQQRHPFGLIVFARNDIYNKCQLQFSYGKDAVSEACCLTSFLYDDKAICVGYKPPKTTWVSVKDKFNKMLTEALNAKRKVLIIGDFNTDFIKKRNSALFQMFKEFGLSNCMKEYEFSTDLKTQIDVAFSNFAITCNYTESFISYHKDVIGIFDLETSSPENRKKAENQNHTAIFEENSYIDGKKFFSQLKEVIVISESIQSECSKLTKYFINTQVIQTSSNKISNLPQQLNKRFFGIPTTPDGSCFYNAISLLLTGKETSTYALRAIETVHIIINSDFLNLLEPTIAQYPTVEETLDMSHYAEIADIIILANILQKEIYVHSFVGEQETGSIRVPPVLRSTSETIHLYLDLLAQHYTALVPLPSEEADIRDSEAGVFQYPNNSITFLSCINC